MSNLAINSFFCLICIAHVHSISYFHNINNQDQYNTFEDVFESMSSSRRRQALTSCEQSRVEDHHNSTVTLHIRFPKVVVNQDDQYMCTAFKAPFSGQDSYITKYVPHTSAASAHHMLVYGCTVPFQAPGTAWNCGSMGGICERGASQQIIYAWAKDAPPLSLPRGIGYRIGDAADINYLVVQIHYSHKTKPGEPDCSGFSALVTQQPQSYSAGIFLLGSGSIFIPARSKYSKSDVSCRVDAPSPLHVFAFRTHAHSLGKVITGYRWRNGETTMIGKGNPQWPHAFYPRVGGSVELEDGDIVLARCVYASDRPGATHVGARGGDEMCNFYMMYYTKEISADEQECWGMSVPHAESLFPSSADDLAPYPGFAGQDSIEAISRGEAEAPAVPEEHHHHHHDESDQHPITTAMTASPTVASEEPQRLQLDQRWSPPPNVGQVGGLAVDNAGFLHVFHRGPRVWDFSSFDLYNVFTEPLRPINVDTVVKVDPRTGRTLHSWGAGFFFLPHGISIDQQDNIWLTDVAMHQVMKFGLNGSTEPALVLGERMVPGSDKHHFCKPADVAVAADGFVYVADGYCNSRVIKFDQLGRFVHSWGEYGARTRESALGPSFFNVPHSIVEAEGELCVADRENGRVQCFDGNGNFIRMLEFRSVMGPTVYAITYSPANHRAGGRFYVVNGQGSVRSCGFTIDSKTGELLGKWCPTQGLSRPHDVAVSPDGVNVYVGQLSGEKLLKFTTAPSLLSTSNVLVPRTQWETTTSKQKTRKPQFSDELPANKPQVSDELPANKPDNPQVYNELPANKPHNSQVSDELPANKPDNPEVSDELPADKPDNPQVSDELPANKLEASPATTTTSTHGKSRPNYQDPNALVIAVLIVLPVLAGIVACVVVCNRRRRLKQYQDLLGHDVIDSYGYPRRTKLASFFPNLTSQRKGFTAIRSDDDSDDDMDELDEDTVGRTIIRR